MSHPAFQLLAAVLLLVLGAEGGRWLTTNVYQPKLADLSAELVSVKSARDNLLALTTEQGLKLGELAKLGRERELAAEKAQAGADVEASKQYAAANAILRGHTGGDQCKAAEAVIDLELFGE